MKIIYLHGWGGTSDEAKNNILKKFGDKVECPIIEYNRIKNIINIVSDWLSAPETIIIGTSFGGYIAYYASVYTEKPALLINPAFYLKDGGELRPDNCQHSPNHKHFLISKKDEVIDVRKTLKFLNEIKVPVENVNIYENLTHQIPLDVFDNAFTEFRNESFNIFQKKNIEEELSKKAYELYTSEEWYTVKAKKYRKSRQPEVKREEVRYTGPNSFDI